MNSIKRKLAGIFAIATILALTSNVSIAQKTYLTQEFDVSDNVNIEVRTSGGSIEVVGENTNEVRVEMYVRKRGRELDREDTDLKGWDIRLEKEGNTVYAVAKKEGKNWGWNNENNVSISFIVYAPVKSMNDLRTSGGSIRLTNLMGDQFAKTSGGSISAEEIGGDISLKTSGGSITINNVEGKVDANTSGGRIKAENVSGGINARTSGGSITLDAVSGNVEAKTSGGSINAEVLNPDDFIELRTSGGSISITVPREKGYDVDLGGNRVRADLQNFKGEFDKNDMEGTLNGGGTKLSAKTSGGSVSLRYL